MSELGTNSKEAGSPLKCTHGAEQRRRSVAYVCTLTAGQYMHKLARVRQSQSSQDALSRTTIRWDQSHTQDQAGHPCLMGVL